MTADLAGLLATAFSAEPGMTWLCGTRKRPWFAATLRLPVDRVLVPGAAALITPPGSRIPPLTQARWAASVLAGCGPRAVRRTLGYLARTEPLKPAGASVLEFVGVLPEDRGRGLARQLITAIPGPLFLTTADPANIPLYTKLGFTVTETVRIGPLTVTAMLRE
ncbi:GNAT family N-acetyltransferase [Longispora albida]|uniref:GNAT family N-acetyltransferase n=1 Tax=Longispora albida TaxID=203523 RepID=UPI0003790660|nr:GNAT family N-acetyltransferase [Longispora albida]